MLRYILISIIFFLLGFTTNLFAQSQKSEYVRIIEEYQKWKITQFKSNNYATSTLCNYDSVTKKNYNGPEIGIPDDIDISFTDINNDNVQDALITFNPVQCDGGNALMNAQIRVLIFSRGSSFITDDKYFDKMESKLGKGWISLEGAIEGTFLGTYYEYSEDDGRCCPSIKRKFEIDYKTKKVKFAE